MMLEEPWKLNWSPAPVDAGFTGYIPASPKPEPVPLGYRRNAAGNLEIIPGGPADPHRPGGEMDPNTPTNQKITEAKVTERASAGFYGRALNAHNLYAEGVDARSLAAQAAANAAGPDAANYFSDDKRRAAQNLADEFIRAVLRKESGAAIPPEEMAQEYRVYFPVPGDVAADLERKRALRLQKIEGLRVQAGDAASDVRLVGGEMVGGGTILPSTGASVGEGGKVGAGKIQLPERHQPSYNDISFSGKDGLKNPLTPEQQAVYDAFTAANPQATAEQLTSFFSSMGVDLDPERAKLMEEAARKGAGFAPGSSAIHNPTPQERKEQAAAQALALRSEELNADRLLPDTASGKLLNHGVTLGLIDEASGVAEGLLYGLRGRNPLEGYRVGNMAQDIQLDRARAQAGWLGTAAEVGGGFLSANPQAAFAPATRAISTIAQGARAGAYGGALAGFGYGEGFSDSAEKAALGGTLGGTLGGGISALSTRLAPRGMNPELAAAAEAENVRLIRPMVDPASRGKAGSLEATAGGQNIIRQGVQAVADDIETAAGRLATGTAQETGTAGERIQAAGQRFIQKSKGVADRLYNRARNLAGGARFMPSKAIEQADIELSALKQNPETNAAEIAFLQKIRNDLSQEGGQSVESLRGIRQTLRGAIDEAGLTTTQAEARAKRILDAAHDDLNVLPPGAASAFRRADMYYRERMVHIDDILERFIGSNKAGEPRLSGEQAFAKLKSMTSPGGDGRRLAALWRNLEPDEQADVASTIAMSLGRRGADEPFSTALFVSQARKLSPAARRTIFGPSGADSIENLVRLSRSLNESTSDFNRSNSGRVAIREIGKAMVAGLLGAGGGGFVGGGGTAAGAALGAAGLVAANAGRNALSARALMSPRVSRWLADAANVTTPTQAEQLTRRLSVIIAREPALAGELAPIQQALSSQVRPMPVAASESVEDEQ